MKHKLEADFKEWHASLKIVEDAKGEYYLKQAFYKGVDSSHKHIIELLGFDYQQCKNKARKFEWMK